MSWLDFFKRRPGKKKEEISGNRKRLSTVFLPDELWDKFESSTDKFGIFLEEKADGCLNKNETKNE